MLWIIVFEDVNPCEKTIFFKVKKQVEYKVKCKVTILFSDVGISHVYLLPLLEGLLCGKPGSVGYSQRSIYLLCRLILIHILYK